MGKKKTLQTLPKRRKKKALSKPDVYRKFVVWMSLPGLLKKLKTQEEFRKEYKVSKTTLAFWKGQESFWEDVGKELNKWGREKTSNILAKTYKVIMKEGSPVLIKLWLQFFEKWSEKIEEKVSGGMKIILEYANERPKDKT